ncbi:MULTISPECIES: folylpolyglutamate synthase/dihydrofolate synthase family protein [unclassified Clostridium]|uniref:bifunctional folylpolyglutamate synthase/dihydrofolate synthase n=1 Tax=unclassified Clostridium TaxID=2614128 RepID=UPI001C8B7133|nr:MULTISPECIES: folylpolyglutamate synthase/dihydrofolate synthase family protein [unclassified Clostridium]MBX9136778.1 bifunctional folylpolyglutamate synthase/dihydrofolate synthase [Clostridium sp. K12(2020)]MBX9143588.1 bifunctional folylpolyglutamate synthase/dihydrofolate synthase [Clostridium sp. K13]MDU2288914.1 folylpolyglutamate synthase/dihydrofolate synthase family protein [Clostridium celatum]
MRYEEAMKYITEVGNFGSNYGLERTHKLLEYLGNPEKELKFIHIAGTNGKGSTTSMITEILMGSGYKVGMYTSPFIEEFEERIQINRNNIPKETLAALMDEVKLSVDKVIEDGYNHPTEFEIITVLMLLYFKRENIDFGVIEVGLGGTLDSTNVITPILQVITSISFDHTNLLGNTLEEIAGEKAGIIKKGIPTVIYPQQEEALKVIKNKCFEMDSELYIANSDNLKFESVVNEDKPYQLLKYNDEIDILLPLLGEHQIINLSVAMKTIEVLNNRNITDISIDNITKSIKSVIWKGRLEVLSNNPYVVIDGAHNIQGIQTLSKNIKKYFEYDNLYLILGILADKDVEEMIKVITPMAKKVYAVTPNSIRAELAEDLKKEIIKYNENCQAYDDYKEAYLTALNDADENDLILASGSLYMVGDMRKIINKN